jgi:hypothetical protein
LEAWRKGDFETIEEILDRNVEWHATELGEWDCHGLSRVPGSTSTGKESDVAGKKRPKSLTHSEKKAPAKPKPKRPKKTSRGK